MKYLVTGGTGFIGRALVRRLLDDGHEVVALVRDTDAAADLEAQGSRLAQGDILDRGSIASAAKGVDGVFHLAAWYEVGRRHPMAEAINVTGADNVLRASLDAGVDRIVYTSSVAVFSDTRGRTVDESYRFDGRHVSEYDRTKWLAHYEVAEPLARDGAPIVIVQPGVVYGRGDRSATGGLIAAYARGRLRYVVKGSAVCWGHVDDTVDGHVRAMERGRDGEAYVIAGPGHSLVEAFEIAATVTGIPAPRLRLPPGPIRAVSRMLTVLSTALRPLAAPAELTRLAGVTYLASSAKARRELGFEARPLASGFAEILPPMVERAQRR